MIEGICSAFREITTTSHLKTASQQILAVRTTFQWFCGQTSSLDKYTIITKYSKKGALYFECNFFAFKIIAKIISVYFYIFPCI